MAEGRTVPHRASTLPIRTLRVEVVKGPDLGLVHVASSDVVTVGTSSGNDIVLTDETVSRYHLDLIHREEHIQLEDHGSTNGTIAGGVFVDRGRISAGTILTLGKTSLRIDDGDTTTVDLDEDHRSPSMRRLMSQVKRAAKSEVSVLLLGETGTGKEVLARAIHEESPRAGQPFEVVDCGALLPTLIASELFGHERGAFTGADRQHIGAFERADGGTLFLDEIGELPSNVQSALLGALERRSFKRLGGQAAISVDVRVVSATHRDLRSEVNAGTFRADLYYRIAVLMMRVPPLRERAEDVPLLVEHFLREAGHQGGVAEIFPESALSMLKVHHWPGNVRELRNFVDAALAMGEAPVLETGSVGPSGGDGSIALVTVAGLPYGEARSSVLRAFEAFYLRELLKRNEGNVSKAARDAKMDRSYLIQMLKRHGLP